MDVRGTIPRSPTSILADIARLRKELHLRASFDDKFRDFILSRERYPFRVLGYTTAAQDLDEVRKDWEAIK